MVERGCKQTQVGVIPEDWQVKSIGEIAIKLLGGGTPSRAVKEFWNGNIPWMTVKDFTSFNPQFTQEFITDLGLRNSATRIVPAGELIIATRIALGQIVKYQVDVTINQDLKTIQLDRNIDTDYFVYFYRNISNKIVEKGSGSTVLGLSVNDLKSFLIPLPPLPEQQAIAEALSDADGWIASLEQLIAKKRLIKEGAMQQLLMPREGWEVKKLGEVCLSVASGTSDTLNNGNLYPIQGSTGIIGFKNYYDYEGQNLTVARVGANAGFIRIISGKYCVSDNTLLIINKANILDIHFLFYSLINKDLSHLIFGSGQPLITGGQLKDTEIFLPPLVEQTRIATILSDMDAEIERLEQRLSKAQQIKQGMMQELLTGRVRLG